MTDMELLAALEAFIARPALPIGELEGQSCTDWYRCFWDVRRVEVVDGRADIECGLSSAPGSGDEEQMARFVSEVGGLADTLDFDGSGGGCSSCGYGAAFCATFRWPT